MSNQTSERPLASDGPRVDAWDPTPHTIRFMTIEDVDLGDVVLGTHQVEGIGRAEQRGKAAIRLDLRYVAGPADEDSARLILPFGHELEVKRYDV